MDITEQLYAAADEARLPNTSELESLSSLVKRRNETLRQIEETEGFLNDLKRDLKDIEESFIPNLMAGVGINQFTLEDGTSISVKEKIYARIPKEDAKRDAALQWLRDRGFGDLIDNTIAVNFKAGEDDDAYHLKNILYDKGYAFSANEGVHFKRLEAFAKEQYEQGILLPEEYFGTFIRSVAEIKKGR